MRDQPLALPDTLDPLVVDCPARLAQQFGDLAIAIAAVLPSKLDNIGGETLIVCTTARTPKPDQQDRYLAASGGTGRTPEGHLRSDHWQAERSRLLQRACSSDHASLSLPMVDPSVLRVSKAQL